MSYYGRSEGNKIRPLFAVLTASPGQHRPLIANVQDGKILEAPRFRDRKFEFLKTAGYRYSNQTVGRYPVTTIYLPYLSDLDPGVVEDDLIEFLCIPAKSQIKQEDPPCPLSMAVPDGYSRDVPFLADLFCTMLGNRVTYPIPTSRTIRTLLFLRVLDRRLMLPPWSTFLGRVEEYGLEDMGYYGPLHFTASSDMVGSMISETVKSAVDSYGKDVLWQD